MTIDNIINDSNNYNYDLESCQDEDSSDLESCPDDDSCYFTSCPDDDSYEADQYELQGCAKEARLEAAALIAKKLLLDHDKKLADACVEFIQTTCTSGPKPRFGHGNSYLAAMNFDSNWDQNFFNFIRGKIWDCLVKDGIVDFISDLPRDVFYRTKYDLYLFAAKVIEQINVNLLL